MILPGQLCRATQRGDLIFVGFLFGDGVLFCLEPGGLNLFMNIATRLLLIDVGCQYIHLAR